MNLEVELPDLGLEGGNEAIVAEWHFEEGDCVEKGEVLLEVSCESGMVDVHAPCSGVLLERVVEEDEIVRVGEPLAVLDVPEEEEEE